MTRNDTIASLAVNSWINGDLVVWPKANLREANLRRADLREANLFGANLRWADLRGATITLGNRTITPSEETAR